MSGQPIVFEFRPRGNAPLFGAVGAVKTLQILLPQGTLG